MQNYSVLMTMYKKDNVQNAKIAIDSMINQTEKTDDFVLVCDGPLTSDLDELISVYENQYDFFNVVRLPQNVGLGEALRQGVLVCKNKLIARMDDDDFSKPDRCRLELVEFQKDETLSIVGSYMGEFDENPQKVMRIKTVPLTHEEIVKLSRKRNPFNHSSVMFKKDDIVRVGNYSSMRTNQDVELWVRCLNNGCKGKNIPETLVKFRFDSKTYERRKDKNNIRLMITVWKEFWTKDYCSIIDYIYVVVVQLVIMVMPISFIKWCYDKLR